MKEGVVDFVDIGGGGSVEMEECVLEGCGKWKSGVEGMKVVESEVVEERIGGEVESDKKRVVIKEY